MTGLHAAFDEYVADVPVYGDLDRAIEQAARERRRRSGWAVAVAAAVAALLAITGVLVVGGDGRDAPLPAGPSPTATPTASATPTGWPGAVRAGNDWPVVSARRLGEPGNPWRGRVDDGDSAIGETDIRVVSGSRSRWELRLQTDPPRRGVASGPVTEYGVVVDTDGDRVGDCQLALANDAPGGQFRETLTNLRSGATTQQVGAPYGYPFDFSLLSKAAKEERVSAVSLYFLAGQWRQPCQRPDGPIQWYAYTSRTENGQVTAWDFAPDAAWLRTGRG